jgi:hypothetical protein
MALPVSASLGNTNSTPSDESKLKSLAHVPRLDRSNKLLAAHAMPFLRFGF